MNSEEELEKKVLDIYNSTENPLGFIIQSGGRVRYVSKKEAKKWNMKKFGIFPVKSKYLTKEEAEKWD